MLVRQSMMTTKLLVIIATGDKHKALAGLMYSRNAMAYGWIPNIRVIFFGPSENLMVEDKEFNKAVQELAPLGHTVACKFTADRDGISEKIEETGVKVEYVGPIITDLLKDGYVPMVW